MKTRLVLEVSVSGFILLLHWCCQTDFRLNCHLIANSHVHLSKYVYFQSLLTVSYQLSKDIDKEELHLTSAIITPY